MTGIARVPDDAVEPFRTPPRAFLQVSELIVRRICQVDFTVALFDRYLRDHYPL